MVRITERYYDYIRAILRVINVILKNIKSKIKKLNVKLDYNKTVQCSTAQQKKYIAVQHNTV